VAGSIHGTTGDPGIHVPSVSFARVWVPCFAAHAVRHFQGPFARGDERIKGGT